MTLMLYGTSSTLCSRRFAVTMISEPSVTTGLCASSTLVWANAAGAIPIGRHASAANPAEAVSRYFNLVIMFPFCWDQALSRDPFPCPHRRRRTVLASLMAQVAAL